MPRLYLKSTDLIDFDVKDRVATITLNRPEKRNAMSKELINEMYGAFQEADALEDVSVVVLQGAGKDFCSGYDLAGAYAGRREGDQEDIDLSVYRSQNKTFDDDCWGMEQSQRKTTLMFDIHKPVIAKVHGNCLAGGTDIAFMCDIVVAAENARIGFPATRANGTPPNNMWFYHCGPQWAKRLLFTGDCVSGKDAARLGLVLDAYPADQLDAEVAELARRVAAVDHELLATQKRVINIAMELSGAKTLQRLALELDARAHLATGPRRTQFKKDMAEGGLKQALTNRDAPFGDGMAKLNWAGN